MQSSLIQNLNSSYLFLNEVCFFRSDVFLQSTVFHLQSGYMWWRGHISWVSSVLIRQIKKYFVHWGIRGSNKVLFYTGWWSHHLRASKTGNWQCNLISKAKLRMTEWKGWHNPQSWWKSTPPLLEKVWIRDLDICWSSKTCMCRILHNQMELTK